MSNLIEIQSQISSLQKQASEIRTRDFSETIKNIQETMTLFGITIKDLESTVKVKTLKTAKTLSAETKKHKDGKDTTSGAKKTSLETKAVRKPVEAKYSGPEGQLWTGRGMTPKWLVAATGKGVKKEDFLIHKASQAPAASHGAAHNVDSHEATHVAHHIESHKESDAALHVEQETQDTQDTQQHDASDGAQHNAWAN